jgi:Flp pilus assembly protein TadD
MHAGKLEEAIAVYTELIARSPNSAEAHYNLGLALKQKDDFAGAETSLRRAVELDPALPDPPYTLGVVLWQTGRFDEAAQAFREATTRRPGYADAHFMLGTVLQQQGDAPGAEAAFRRAIQMAPDSAEAHLGLAQLLRRRGEAEAARAELHEAERLRKRKADQQAAAFAIDLGQRQLAGNDLAGAIQSFRDAVRLAPDDPQAHLRLSRALETQGHKEEARTHRDEAYRLAPYLKLAQADR